MKQLTKRLTIMGMFHCQKLQLITLAEERYDKANPDHEMKLLAVRGLILL